MGVWQAERKLGESNEQACSGQEWVKPCKLLTDRTWPRSLCLREGGREPGGFPEAELGKARDRVPGCPGHLLPHTGKKLN